MERRIENGKIKMSNKRQTGGGCLHTIGCTHGLDSYGIEGEEEEEGSHWKVGPA